MLDVTVSMTYDTVTMNCKQAIALARANGWQFVGQVGSHMKFEHPSYSYKVVIPNHGHKEIASGTADKLKKQIG
jgi:predicted RNA binding protein YcfA (HicA-like mRNA interferase family)